jgi:hypothetical protein
MRLWLYNLIGELELAFAASIRDNYTDIDAPLQLLSEERRRTVESQSRNLTKGNVDVDPVQLLCLSDLVNIVAKQEDLRRALGFSSRTQAEDCLNGLVVLRNQAMHPVRSLLEDVSQDLLNLQARLRIAARLLYQMREIRDIAVQMHETHDRQK